MPLMQMGSFVFSIPTYSFESLKRQTSSRAESQMVIGAAPPTHLLGPGEETVQLTSTFYPRHFNAGGLAQLQGIRQACFDQTPMMLVSIGGVVYGRWVIKEVGDEQKLFHPNGDPQQVDVDMTLLRYNGGQSGSAFFTLF